MLIHKSEYFAYFRTTHHEELVASTFTAIWPFVNVTFHVLKGHFLIAFLPQYERKKNMNKKKVLSAIIAVVILAILITVFAVVYSNSMNAGKDTFSAASIVSTSSVVSEVAKKQVNIEIVFKDGTKKTETISTDAKYLRGALDEAKLVSGKESSTGLFVKTVAGYTVDDSKQEWWCFTKGGAAVMTGVDTTPIADGDKFEITLKTGY